MQDAKGFHYIFHFQAVLWAGDDTLYLQFHSSDNKNRDLN